MIASICSEPKVLEIFRIINILISIIRIIVPIILIFSVLLKFMSVIKTGDEDSFSKVKKSVITNIVAAVIIFLIPSLVNIVVKISFSNSGYKNCLVVRTVDEINAIYEEKMEALVLKVEETLNIYDYNNAYSYLNNIKNEEKRNSYEERLKIVKEKIDELNKKNVVVSTGYGKNIPVTDEITTACEYIFNEDTVQVQLETCTDQYQYKNPDIDLPGGAIFINGNWKAKETIPFSQYRMGLFFGEIPLDYAADSFLETFAVMYKNVIFKSRIQRQIMRGEGNKALPVIYYVAGSCTQNYRQSLYESRYVSGEFKNKIDQIMNDTKYFILVYSDGSLVDVRYNTHSGILDVMKKATNEGKDILGIVEALKSGHTQTSYYKDANVYDCRNLIEGQDIDDVDINNINRNIIYLGDSRIQMFRDIKNELGFNDNKESIYARFSTGYDDYFRSHIISAKDEINSNKDKSYAITVNYGVNSKRAYKGFCEVYKSFVNNMDKKNQFYIVSVNPFDESKVKAYKDDNTNEKVEIFNDYMKNTCINEIKANNPSAEVYYCDVYGSIPLEKWASNNYISDDGIHYTTEGSKYIYI